MAKPPLRFHSSATERHTKSDTHPSVSEIPGNRLTVDEAEVRKFSALAASWWRDDDRGPFAPLHSLNALRVPLVRRSLLEDRAIPANEAAQQKPGLPLSGFRILDVGCGGGIFSEGLGRLGATVTGLDASKENVAAASLHVSYDPELASRVSYRAATIETLASEVAEMHTRYQSSSSSATAASAASASSSSSSTPSHSSPSADAPESASSSSSSSSSSASSSSSPPVPDLRYDAVLASEVLEHVADRGRFLDACAELVKVSARLGSVQG